MALSAVGIFSKATWVAVLIAVASVLFGCAGASTGSSQTTAAQPGNPKGQYGYEFADDPLNARATPESGPPAPPGGADQRLAEAPSEAGAPSPGAGNPSGESVREVSDAAAGPLLIYTAQVHIAVFEVRKALEAAERLARDSKGYLVRQGDQSITFRIPAEHFQTVLGEVLKLGDVIHRDVQARDVTDEFFDVQTRTRTLEAMRNRFEELLRRAQNVQEALAVERELGRVVDEIERLKGRLKLLRELIAFSTITIEFRPRVVESLKSDVQLPFPWLKSLSLSHLLSL